MRSAIAIQQEPIKAMRKLNLQSGIAKRIRDDAGLTIFTIEGMQQSGKSSYSMRALDEIYGGDKGQVLSHIVMSIEDLKTMLYNAIKGGYRERCIVWDDMSVTGSAAEWMNNPKNVKKLSALGDTLGIATKGLILTSPSGDMVKAFRNYLKYKVIISSGNGKYGRIARGYWVGKSPMNQRYCQTLFEDEFDTRIPYYEEYAIKRREISLKAVLDMNSDDKPAESTKPLTKAERAWEIKRDWKAGVYGDMVLKQVAKIVKHTEGISYDMLRSVSV